MTTRLDARARSHLEGEHVRFDLRVRDLLLRPGTPADWTRSVDVLATDIAHHLDEEANALLPLLELEGGRGKRTAAVLRATEARIRDDLRDLRRRNEADAANLLLLSYDLNAHSAHADTVLHEWEAASSVPPRHMVASEAACVLTGMLVGATVGAVAGPPGIAGGAIAGGVAAGVAMVAAHNASEDLRVRDEYLDREIGVFGGHIGEASPKAPRALIGAFSAAASGAGGRGNDDQDDAAGPIARPASG
jgi:hypothetical protein